MKHGIIAENIWKKFHQGEIHKTLRDLIPAVAGRIIGKGTKRSDLGRSDFWALQNISFTVEPGKALGIIGSNGAGKSTILKLLNRIIRPNRGSIEIKGRVGALIELAAGFHPDLTGRENVFLQGAIMGMKQAEISQKFDEIVAFSEVESFMDTPVKRYSSGMNTRLGFSIAAHLDPDVLLIDEVLAVGDFQFQQKAFNRLKSIVKSGIPVVVVSHQLDRVAALCDEVILLNKGKIVKHGSAQECISTYLNIGTQGDTVSKDNRLLNFGPVTLLNDNMIISGDWIQLKIPLSLGKNSPSLNKYNLKIRVRSIDNGRTIYLTGIQSSSFINDNKSPYEIGATLQMNGPSGSYIFDAEARLEGKLISTSDPVSIVVHEGGNSFKGSVQMNAKFEVL